MLIITYLVKLVNRFNIDGLINASNKAHNIDTNIHINNIKKYLPINPLKLSVFLPNACNNSFIAKIRLYVPKNMVKTHVIIELGKIYNKIPIIPFDL